MRSDLRPGFQGGPRGKWGSRPDLALPIPYFVLSGLQEIHNNTALARPRRPGLETPRMLRTIPIALICSLLLSTQSYGQDVIVPRQSKPLPKFKKEETPAAEAPKSVAAKAPETSESKKAESEKAPLPKSETAGAFTKKDVGENSHPDRASAIKFEPVRAISAKEPAPSPSREKVRPTKAESSKSSAMNDSEDPAESKIQSARTESTKKVAPKESVASASVEKSQSPKVEPTKSEPAESTKNSVSKKSVANADSEKKQAAKSEPAHPKEAIVSVNSEKKAKAESTKEPTHQGNGFKSASD